MARYIDADALIAEYDRVHVGPAGGARKLMVEAPAADVAPKSEVVRKICCEIEEEIVAALESNYKVRSQSNITDELLMWVQGKIDALRGIEGFVEELKKKYTEEK